MSTINIFGMIECDAHAWLRAYSDFDRVTYPDDVREALASADVTSDLEINLDSPGGYVDGGRSMIVSIQDWCREHGRKANVTIGGMACSMAAALALSFNGVVRVHDASMFMVHGARVDLRDTVVAQQLRDMADSLDVINNYMVRAISARTGKTEEEARAMIDGTKETYFGGTEMVEAGLADEVIGAALPAESARHVPDADAVRALAKNVNAGNDAGITLAAVACAAFAANHKKEKSMNGKKSDLTAAEKAEAEKAEAEKAAAEKAAAEKAEAEKAAAEKAAAEKAAAEKAEAEKVAAEKAAAEKAEAEKAEAIKAAVESAVADAVAPLKAEIESLTKAKAEAEARAATVEGQLAGLRKAGIEKAMTPGGSESAAASRREMMIEWRDAVRAANGDILRAKAAKPDLYAAVCAAH